MDLSEAKDLHHKALHTTEDTICESDVVDQPDSNFTEYITSLNIDRFPDRLIDFSLDDNLINLLNNLIDFLERELKLTFRLPGHIIRIGSCRDGSKVGNVNEVDSLFVVDKNFVSNKLDGQNQYKLNFDDKHCNNPLALIDDFADAVEESVQKWPKFCEETGIRHGGFATPHFNGVRYNGPAVTILLTYESRERSKTVDLSMDMTIAFSLPADNNVHVGISKQLSVIQRAFKDRIISKEGVHFVPDIINNTWLITTAQVEADLFEKLTKSVLKQAFCYIKILSHDLNELTLSQERTSIPEGRQLSDNLQEMKEKCHVSDSQTVSVEDECGVSVRCMRYAHGFLSADAARRHHESVKADISLNTAAMKHILLQEALNKQTLFKDDNLDELYPMLSNTFQCLGNEKLSSVPHAFIDDCKISMFSFAKPVLLKKGKLLLQLRLKQKCSALSMKLNIKAQPSTFDELNMDIRPKTVTCLREYLVPTSDINSSEGKYTYEICVDPSISPKRCSRVRDAKMIINGLHNTCGGSLALTCADRYKAATIAYWKSQISSELQLSDSLEETQAEFSPKGKVMLLCLPIGPAYELVSYLQEEIAPKTRKLWYFSMHDDGSIMKYTKMDFESMAKQSHASTDDQKESNTTSSSISTPSLAHKPEGHQAKFDVTTKLKKNSSLSFRRNRKLKQAMTPMTITGIPIDKLSIFQESNPTSFTPRKDILTQFSKNIKHALDHIEYQTPNNAFSLASADLLMCFSHDLLQKNCPLTKSAPVEADHATEHMDGHSAPLLLEADVLYVDTESTILINTLYENRGPEHVESEQKNRAFELARVISKKLVEHLPHNSQTLNTCIRVYPVVHWLHEGESTSIEPCPNAVPLTDIKTALAGMFLEYKSTFTDRINNDRSLHLTGEQIEKVYGIELVKLGIVEGPPGSGKTLLEQHLCEKQGKNNCAIICFNVAVKEYITFHQKADAFHVRDVGDMLQLLRGELRMRRFIIVDDAQFFPWDENDWRSVFDMIISSHHNLYLFMDSKYQTHKGEENVEIIKGLVGKYQGFILLPLQSIYRNSRVVVDYMENAASKIRVDSTFNCFNPHDGDDIKITNIPYMKPQTNRNGLLCFVRNIAEKPKQSRYSCKDIAILFEASGSKTDDNPVSNMTETFHLYWPESSAQRANQYPITGLVIDQFDNFVGLEARFVIVVLETNSDITDPRYRTAIASRGVERVEFIQEDIVDYEKIIQLDFDSTSIDINDVSVPRDDESIASTVSFYHKYEEELLPKDHILLHACQMGDLSVVENCLRMGVGMDVRSKQSGLTPIVIAAYWGFAEIVDFLYEKVGNILVSDVPEKEEALMCAAYWPHLDVVQLLIDKGTHYEAPLDTGLVIKAVKEENVQMVRWLIDHGEDVEEDDVEDCTPLHWSCKLGNAEIANVLLQKGAQMESCSDDLCIPLHYACDSGLLDLVTIFINADVDAENRNSFNETPIHRAARNGHTKTVQFLINRGVSLDDIDDRGHTPLHISSRHGHIQTTNLLIEHGSELNPLDKQNKSPLLLSCEEGHYEIARMLVEQDVERDIPDIEGYTPFHSSCRSGHLEIAKLLIKKGANVKSSCKAGLTPIQTACASGHPSVVRLLLDKGVKLDRDEECILLHNAAKAGNIAIAKLLVEQGTDTDITNEEQRTALEFACEGGHYDLANFLLENGSNQCHHGSSTSILYRACSDRQFDFADEMIACEASMSESETYQLLLQSAIDGHMPTIRWLITREFDINAPHGGRSPLYEACKQGHSDVVELLIDEGALLHQIEREESYAPLVAAASGGHTTVVAFLIERGAKHGREAALLEALGGGHMDIVKLLKSKGVKLEQDTIESLFESAVLEGKIKMAKWLLMEDVRTHQVPTQSWTLNEDVMESLLAASSAGHFDFVKDLVTASVEISQYAKDRLLLEAVKYGHLHRVKWLMKKGGNPNFLTEDGHSIISVAILEERFEVVRLFEDIDNYLSEHDANETLLLAVERNRPEAVKHLLKRGANLNHTDEKGNTALSIVVDNQYNDVLDIILPPNIATCSLNSLFRAALDEGYMHLIKWCLNRGRLSTEAVQLGKDLILNKYEENTFYILKELVTAGAILTTEEMQPLLSESLADNDLEKTKWLVAQGADIPEHDATEFDVVKQLVLAGVRINEQHINNMLMKSTIGGEPHQIIWLLEQGGNVNAVDDEGDSLLMVAYDKDNSRVVHLLVEKELLDAGATLRQGRKNKMMRSAVDAGSLHHCSVLFYNGADINDQDDEGQTALHKACDSGSVQIAQFLIEKGADINDQDDEGQTALYKACDSGSVQIAQFLIEKGVTVNCTDNLGQTPLHMACGNDSTPVIEYLINNGAKLNCTDNLGQTPLHVAFRNESPTAIKYLTNNGANLDIIDENGHTALGTVCCKNPLAYMMFSAGVKLSTNESRQWLSEVFNNEDVECIKWLFKKGACSPATALSALSIAIEYGQCRVARFLIKQGVSVNDSDASTGSTPLFLSCVHGHYDLVLELVAHGAILTDDHKCAALKECSKNRQREVVTWMLDHGGISSKETDLCTHMYIACIREDVDAVINLVREGVQMTQEDKDELLIAMARRGHLDGVIFLLIEGANPEFPDFDGRTGAYWASENGHMAILQILSHLASVNLGEQKPLTGAAKEGRMDTVKFLLSIVPGAHLDARDKYGRTALFKACQMGHIETAQYLIESGARFSQPDKDELLHETAMRVDEQLSCVQWLIAQGADVESKDDVGNSALYWSCWRGHLDIANALVKERSQISQGRLNRLLLYHADRNQAPTVRFLVDQGADPRHRDKYGNTAAMLAFERGYYDLVDYIISRADIKVLPPLDRLLRQYPNTGHLDRVKWLRKKGADVEDTNLNGERELATACEYHDYDETEHINYPMDIIEEGMCCLIDGRLHELVALLQLGLKPSALTHDGLNALQLACRHGHVTIFEELLSWGAEWNEAEKLRSFVYACGKGHFAIVQWLLGEGAYIEVMAEQGETVLSLALDQQHYDIATLFLEHGMQMYQDHKNNILLKSVRTDDTNGVRWSLEQGAEFNALDNDGNTAMAIAFSEKRIDIVKELLLAGAHLDTDQDLLNTFADHDIREVVWARDRDVLKIDQAELDIESDLDAISTYFQKNKCVSGKGHTNVALKVMTKKESTKRDFLNEAKTLRVMDHSNIIRLHGVASQERHVYVITEYMSEGSLLSYLRSQQSMIQTEMSTRLNLCYQVSLALEYMESTRFVHRDVAARNCFVGASGICKIGNFEMASFLVDNHVAVKGQIPFRWTSPEIFDSLRYTRKCEVWAFGILMWEIFSGGERPYSSLNNKEAVAAVCKNKFILDRPSSCPHSIYEIMRSCWDHKPNSRPDFAMLSAQCAQKMTE